MIPRPEVDTTDISLFPDNDCRLVRAVTIGFHSGTLLSASLWDLQVVIVYIMGVDFTRSDGMNFPLTGANMLSAPGLSFRKTRRPACACCKR